MSDFKIFEYELNTGKLPAGSKALTFVLLADLHNKTYGPDNERLLEAIDAQKPDAILVAGDLLIAHTKQSFAPVSKASGERVSDFLRERQPRVPDAGTAGGLRQYVCGLYRAFAGMRRYLAGK